jgi:parallel beta-helix repeat protein
MRTATGIMLATVGLLRSADVAAITYYVATTGKDGAKGTEAEPVRTIAEGSTRLESGDTLLIREGTYDEVMQGGVAGFFWRNGKSMKEMTRYSSYPGEKVVIKPSGASGGGYFVVHFTRTTQYIEVSGLVLDGTNASSYTVKFDAYDGVAASHNRLLGNELRYGRIGVGGGGNACEIINNEIHHMKSYGMYTGTSYDGSGALIEGNVIHDNGGYGIHLYASAGGVNNNVIRNNVFFGNGKGYQHSSGWKTAPAVIISRGTNNQMYNNVLYGNHAGIFVGYGAVDSLIANNTVYGSATYGIDVNSAYSGSKNARVVNNLVWGNKSSQITNNATNTTLETNLTSDSLVLDAAGANFHLQPKSPAIDTGSPVEEVTVDFDGVPRPQGAGFDIGAFEYCASSCGSSGGNSGAAGTGGSDAAAGAGGGAGEAGSDSGGLTGGAPGSGGVAGGSDTGGDAASATGEDEGGCACSAPSRRPSAPVTLLLSTLVALGTLRGRAAGVPRHDR